MSSNIDSEILERISAKFGDRAQEFPEDSDYRPPTLSEVTDEDAPDALESSGLEESTENSMRTTPVSGTASIRGNQAAKATHSEQAPPTITGEQQVANIDASLKELSKINGFIAAAIVDADSGMTLGTLGGGDDFDIEIAAAANTDVVSAKLRAAAALELKDSIDDILITLSSQYHLIRLLPSNRQIFIYVALNRATANLALARLSVNKVAETVEF